MFYLPEGEKWLDEHDIELTERHIVEENPSYEELKRVNCPVAIFVMTGQNPLFGWQVLHIRTSINQSIKYGQRKKLSEK